MRTKNWKWTCGASVTILGMEYPFIVLVETLKRGDIKLLSVNKVRLNKPVKIRKKNEKTQANPIQGARRSVEP